MKKTSIWNWIGIMTFCLLVSNYTMAQKPSLACEEPMYNFGTINEADGKVSHDFVIKNTGKEPLVITDIHSTCGCTVPDWSKAPIRPGEESKVSVTYDPTNRPGRFSKTVTITTSGQKRSFLLFIRGEVIAKEK